jgi:DNA-binding CsgD family transcriptional regulator
LEETVTALTARDAEHVLRFVAAAEELAGDHAFTPEVLVELGKLVEADWVAYAEQDRLRRRFGYSVGRLGDEFGSAEVTYWEIAAEHPVCSRHTHGDTRALKLSDFMRLSELRRSRIYSIWFKPCGVEHELTLAIPSAPSHTKTFIFDRGPGRDFTERDRRVLEILQPHLARLWRGARLRLQLRAALARLNETPDPDTPGHDELGLTRREQEVLAWVAQGKTNAEVAEILWVTPSTVRKHLENVYEKLGVHSRTAAATRFLGGLGA